MEGAPFGRYRLVDLLGRGGMGEVWRAYDTEIDRVVALKVLPATFADDEVFQERFRREARAAARLDEPHVVPTYDFGEIDGRLYVSMRLIRGDDLQALLAGGPLPPARAVRIIEQIASALGAAHGAGLVHRDVKPSNILIAEDDFAYLIDFGIARAVNQTTLTNTGAVIGTWAYMAPERLSTGQADFRSDIYALACVLHEALTGYRPFPGDSLEQQVVGHLTTPPPRPSTIQSAVPKQMDEVIAAGMAKDPDRRYKTAKEFAHAARTALKAAGARPPQRAEKVATQVNPPATAPRLRTASAVGKDFWFDVGIDPIRIINSDDDFVTLRCYLGDVPIFLGRRRRINVFTSQRALIRYLASDAIHDMSALSTYDQVRTAAINGALRPDKIKITEDNVYALDGVSMAIAERPNEIDPDELELAIELLSDVGRYARSNVVEDCLRKSEALGDLVERVMTPNYAPKRWRSVADAGVQWTQLIDFLEAHLHIDPRST